jgi:5'-phosphate synthase pdxT subunit
MTIGVLALQGGFAAHRDALHAIGLYTIEVRTARDLTRVDGLVLPGGESTVQLKMIGREPGLARALDAFVRAGAPVLATCAGLILAARSVEGPEQRSFGWLDVVVRRNAYGRQIHSAERVADDGTEVVLIRAPRIVRVGPRATVELTMNDEPILVRDGNVWGATFHPELTETRSLQRAVFSSSSSSSSSSAPGNIDDAVRISPSQNSRQ